MLWNQQRPWFSRILEEVSSDQPQSIVVAAGESQLGEQGGSGGGLDEVVTDRGRPRKTQRTAGRVSAQACRRGKQMVEGPMFRLKAVPRQRRYRKLRPKGQSSVSRLVASGLVDCVAIGRLLSKTR